MTVAAAFAGIRDSALELLYPTLCLGCETRGEWFCDRCTEQSVLPRGLDHCQLCNRLTSAPGSLCRFDRKALGLTGLVSFGNYRAEPLRRAIRAVKFEGIFAGVPGLVAAAQARYQPFLATRPWTATIPIPLSKQRLRERGFNQAELIAQAVVASSRHSSNSNFYSSTRISPQRESGRATPQPWAAGGGEALYSPTPVSTGLIRTRDTQHQTELGRKQRQQNLTGAFTWQGDRLSGAVLLVDDVVTTGATLAEAAKVLRTAGAREIWALTLAYESPA